MLDVVAAGEYEGRTIDAGLIIHEGQLTYSDHDLDLCVDLGLLDLNSSVQKRDLCVLDICRHT